MSKKATRKKNQARAVQTHMPEAAAQPVERASVDETVQPRETATNAVAAEAVAESEGNSNTLAAITPTREETLQESGAQMHVTAVPIAEAGLTTESAVEIIEEQPEKAKTSERREIVKSATLVMLGNLGSSLMGMVRQIAVASTGAAISGPFFSALSPAQKFNDLLVNGSVQGALIPTFNDYAEAEKRDELRRLVFTVVNLIAIIMTVSSVFFLFVAPWLVAHVFAWGYTPSEQVLTVQFARIIFFSLIALGPFAVLQSALYARKEFGWTAFAATAYHIGIIVGAIFTSIVGERYFGRYGIALGVPLGTLGEIVLLIPGLRNQRLRYMFVLDLKHPALKRILKLYAPISFSFLVSSAFAILDQSLASGTPCMAFMQAVRSCGADNYSAMQFATTLIQFPVGLVAAALSFAVLPTLTGHMREGDIERFKNVLQLGFRLGLLLMIPAAAGLIVLRLPIVSLIFQHQHFTSQNSLLGATALQNYAYQLPFIAIDQLLIAAFYARRNTIIPVAVLVISELGYLAIALPFWHTIGMPALALANTVQNSLHAIILLIWLRVAIGSIHIRKTLPALLKILLATAIMVAIAWGLQDVFGHMSLFSLSKLSGRLLTVVIVGGLSAAAYFGTVLLLKVEEVGLLKGAILAKLGRK